MYNRGHKKNQERIKTSKYWYYLGSINQKEKGKWGGHKNAREMSQEE